MPDIDDFQLEILGKIGIDIWQCRERKADENAGLDEVQAGNLTGTEAVADSKNSEPHKLAVFPDVQGGEDTLDKVAMEVSQCSRCPLHANRIKAVAGTGNSQAEWMFIGEAPGKNEDQQGLPFVGRAGQLLDAIIAALQMQRADVFIANVIKCRPPANRDPLDEEVAQCEPYLHRQLALVKPKIIVALGRISAQALLKTSAPLATLRGRVHHYGVSNTPMIVTYHPAYLLRSPGQKSKAWEDLLLAKSVVAGTIGNIY